MEYHTKTMERSDLPGQPFPRPKNLAESLSRFAFHGDVDSPPSSAALKLAAMLAERLEAVMPPPFHVRAEGGWVSHFNDEQWDGSSEVAGVLDHGRSGTNEDLGEQHEPRPMEDQVASICWNVLSAAQDMVAETTHDPWPRLLQGGMANPGTRVEAGRVYLWYGPDDDSEATAVLSLVPIELVALEER